MAAMIALTLLLLSLRPSSPSPEPVLAIPRILHQITTLPSNCPRSEMEEIVPGKFLNKALAGVIGRMWQLNPTWSYRLWDAPSIAGFLDVHRRKLNYELELQPEEDIKHIFDSINPHYGAARADFFRYILLYLQGGVYMDLKGLCLVPLDQYLQPSDRFVAIDEWNQTLFRGWGQFGNDSIPGRGREHPSWFMASAPRHPAMKAILLRVLAYHRHYFSQCLELKLCPSGLLYRFRDDHLFNSSHWPKSKIHCYGHFGTLVMIGPVVYSTALTAILQQPGRAAAALRIRLVPADMRTNLVWDFRMLEGTDPTDRKRIYCTNTSYYSLKEPIYLPLHISLQLLHHHTSISPEPAISLECPSPKNSTAQLQFEL
eukprot:EG_transcript_10134